MEAGESLGIFVSTHFMSQQKLFHYLESMSSFFVCLVGFFVVVPFFFFRATHVACGSSQARGRTLTTAVTTLDPYPAEPPGSFLLLPIYQRRFTPLLLGEMQL